MNFEIVEKLVPTKFVMLNGIEFEFVNLIGCIQQFLDIADVYYDAPLKDYELEFYDETKKLEKLDLITSYIGSRMAHLYCIKNEESYKTMKDLLSKLYDSLD